MPASNTYVRSASVALPSAGGCRASSVVAFGCALVVIGAYCFCPSVFAQTSDSRTAEEPTKSWTATTDLKSDNLIPERIPVRIIESHSQNGNRTLDKRSVEIRGDRWTFRTLSGHRKGNPDPRCFHCENHDANVRLGCKWEESPRAGNRRGETHPGRCLEYSEPDLQLRCQWTASTGPTRNRGDEKDREGSRRSKYDRDAAQHKRRFGCSFQDARTSQASRERYRGN